MRNAEIEERGRTDMDELQRYVDILFADYRQFEAAERLRLEMLNDLLLQKETLQVQGQSEHEAERNVLASLDAFGAPAEGNILIYSSRYLHDSSLSLLLWLLVGLVLSVPLTVFGNPFFSIALICAVSVAAVRYFRAASTAPEQQAEFIDLEYLQQRNRRFWLVWIIFGLIWWLGAYLWSSEGFFIGSPVEESGLYGKALLLTRFYPPFCLLVVPLWAWGRTHLIWQAEVGAAERREMHERAF